MDMITLILLGLATWRVSSLLVNEAGPFDVFMKIRTLAGIEHVEGAPVVFPDGFFAQLLSCVWCASIWVGAGWYAFWLAFPKIAVGCATVLAFSTFAILVENHVSK